MPRICILEGTEHHNIKALKEVCGVGWVTKNNDVVGTGKLNEGEVNVRAVAVDMKKPWTLRFKMRSDFVKVLDEFQAKGICHEPPS
jgi:hypothetical protein